MTMNHGFARAGTLLLLALSVAALSACGMMQKASTEAAAEQAKPLTDGEIVAVLHAINQGEIRQAELAMQKSDNPEVLNTARMIITDHRQSDRRAMSLAAMDDIQPQENALSRGLEKQAQQMTKQLQELSGSEFDRAYLEGQVRLHEMAIDTVQNDLLPAATNPRLREMLSRTPARLREHLQEAHAGLETQPRA